MKQTATIRGAIIRGSNHLGVAITGASGLIGRHLTGKLRAAGHPVFGLARDSGSGENGWNVATGEIRTAGKAEVVVHLAGKSVATRWTAKARKEIWNSRVPATAKLCGYLAGMPVEQRPGLLIAASAVGIYGSRGDEVLTESSALAREKTSFLADICRAWEAATKPAEAAGIRVIHLRIGVVLSREGGALAKLLTPTKLGLGGPVGRGTQFMSWISLGDLGRLMMALVEGERGSELRGAVNAVSPNPVRQHEFMRTLGRVVHRPTVFPMPAFMVKLIFGEMGREVLLGSQRAVPGRLPAGFQFEHADLEGAIRAELGR